MHALFAHAYHLARFGLHVLLLPIWRPPAAALAVALAGRAAGFARDPHCAGLTAGVAVLAGWLLLNPDWAAWPPPPVARLPGLALLLMLDVWPGGRTRQGRLVTAVIAAVAAWWLRGAPGSLAGLAGCVPVAVGLAVALPLARWLARGDAGWGSVAAALVLAGGLMLTGASAHWARAALVPGLAALVLVGGPGAAGALGWRLWCWSAGPAPPARWPTASWSLQRPRW